MPITASIYRPPDNINLNFAGTITGGTFTGAYDSYCSPCSPGYLFLDMTVAGTWSNGWKSQGDIFVVDDYRRTKQLMYLTTTVPEPGSLVMLGSGLTVLAGGLRRKLL